MGVIRVTSRPSYCAKQEQEESLAALKSEPETILTGKLAIEIEVGGIRDSMKQMQQKRIEKVVSSAIHEKGVYVRRYNHGDDRGYYTWEKIIVHQNSIYTTAMPVEELSFLEEIITSLAEEHWHPERVVLTFYPDGGDVTTVYNLVNILESRRPLIEQALSLRKAMQIVVNHSLALSIPLSAFSYPKIEAAALLLTQACKMALETNKVRMKPCDLSNPKYQMRTWLLRLGFIGTEFERPRKTLLESLDGDMAFFNEEQKKKAVAKRKAKKLNTPVSMGERTSQ